MIKYIEIFNASNGTHRFKITNMSDDEFLDCVYIPNKKEIKIISKEEYECHELYKYAWNIDDKIQTYVSEFVNNKHKMIFFDTVTNIEKQNPKFFKR